MQVRELQPRLNRHAARAETDVPQDALLLQFQGLQCQQTYGCFSNHLLTTIEQGKLVLGDSVGPRLGVAA